MVIHFGWYLCALTYTYIGIFTSFFLFHFVSIDYIRPIQVLKFDGVSAFCIVRIGSMDCFLLMFIIKHYTHGGIVTIVYFNRSHIWFSLRRNLLLDFWHKSIRIGFFSRFYCKIFLYTVLKTIFVTRIYFLGLSNIKTKKLEFLEIGFMLFILHYGINIVDNIDTESLRMQIKKKRRTHNKWKLKTHEKLWQHKIIWKSTLCFKSAVVFYIKEINRLFIHWCRPNKTSFYGNSIFTINFCRNNQGTW